MYVNVWGTFECVVYNEIVFTWCCGEQSAPTMTEITKSCEDHILWNWDRDHMSCEGIGTYHMAGPRGSWDISHGRAKGRLGHITWQGQGEVHMAGPRGGSHGRAKGRTSAL